MLRAVLLLGTTCAAVFGATAPAEMGRAALQQQPAAALPDAPASIARRACGVVTEEGRLWGLGGDYRALFDRGGVEYTPALGSRAPRSYPLRFTLESIRRGGQTLLTEAHAPVQPCAEERAVVYARDRGILERYDVRQGGVELSFTFPERPPGRGDLVVRGRIDTDLPEAQVADGGGLRFVLEDLGGVSIGSVTGIDARGRRASGELRSDGDHVELVLPAAFVDAASYPLVLDPLIGTVFSAATGFDDHDSDVAWDGSNATYLVVWERRFSLVHSDIRGQRLSSVGNPIGGILSVSTNNGTSARPSVANINLSNRFLVVWQQAQSILGPWDIACRAVDPDGTTSATVNVAATTADELHPDVAGDPDGTDDEAVVVWEETGGGIHGAEVTLPFTGNPVPLPAAVLSGNSNHRAPAVSKGSSLIYVVVFERDSPTTGNVDVLALAVTRNLAVLGTGELAVADLATADELHADVDGDGADFMVVYQRNRSHGAPGHDVYCRMVQWDGSELVAGSPASVVSAVIGVDEIDPAVGFLGPKYLVAWSEGGTPTPFDYDIGILALDPSTCTACGPRGVVGGTGTSVLDTKPAIGTQRSGNLVAGTGALVSFHSYAATPPFASTVFVQRFEGQLGGSVGSVRPGCGRGGTALAEGLFAVGNTEFLFLLEGIEASASLTALSIGIAGWPITTCGACQIIDPVIVTPAVISPAGEAVLAFPLPCKFLPFVGAQLEVQWLTLGTSTSPCVLVGTLSVSNTLRTTLGL